MDWQAMLFLGAFHGINPGMGWLFAVALGMQQGSARGVWRALPAIALGHAVAVGVVVFAVGLARLAVPIASLNVLDRARVDDARTLPALAPSASTLRRDAGGVSRSRGVVVSHGLGTRRGFHGAAIS